MLLSATSLPAFLAAKLAFAADERTAAMLASKNLLILLAGQRTFTAIKPSPPVISFRILKLIPAPLALANPINAQSPRSLSGVARAW
jgi:hypothetical protein